MITRTLVFILGILASVQAFYLPGIFHDYTKNQEVPLHVNALTSPNSVVPFDFYYKKFGFCRPHADQKPKSVVGSLGSVLFGDRIYESPGFKINMLNITGCEVLCTVDLDKENVNFLIERIQERYLLNWFIDGLPAARWTSENNNTFKSVGFELGFRDSKLSKKEVSPILNNHYIIEIQYHEPTTESTEPIYRVVGVIVHPRSIKYENEKDIKCSSSGPPVDLKYDTPTKVTYTYSVFWSQTNDITWGTRWDDYLHIYDVNIHWFSIINSFVIVLFLTFMVAMILLRNLHKDISRYNQTDVQEDAQEEYGWKLVHGDVFRTPKNSMMLSVFIGNGVQLLTMCFITLLLALLGFLSPAMRGALVSTAIGCYVCLGFLAGYVSARFYKMFGGEAWKRNMFVTAFLIPGISFIVLFILNFFLVAEHSSAAVPFGTFCLLFFLWILVSTPLCFAGAYAGFKKDRIENPVRTNQIPRQIPQQLFYLRKFPSILLGGILPFGAIFIELYFIMNSIWFNRLYYVFGFLFLVFVILCITCSEVTILMCYFHLCAEDYHWWWRAFLTSGCCAFYVFCYSILYFFTRLEFDTFTSTVLYFGWTGLFCFLFFIASGTVGFVTCLWFIRKIYSAIKID